VAAAPNVGLAQPTVTNLYAPTEYVELLHF